MVRRPSNDVLLLFILLLARTRIDTLAEWAAFPTDMLQADVARLVGSVWPQATLSLMADRQTTDPVTLLLISLSFGLFLMYFVADVVGDRLSPGAVHRIKLVLVAAIIGTLVVGQAALYIGLRHISNPAAYTHDGGVIQTEVTIEYLLAGVNPYVADYLDTPMATWGTEYRTALYHFPYLPWTFLFSAPFYLLSQLLVGWFDQRFVYLLLFVATLVLTYGLAGRRIDKLAMVMVIGLNPILASDVVFGQNDLFVLFWVVLGVYLFRRAELAKESGGHSQAVRWLAFGAVGLACAAKPTAWFLLPFLLLYTLRDSLNVKGREGRLSTNVTEAIGSLVRQMWPLVLVFVVVVGPWFVWNPAAMVDDVWSWASGTADIPYQIRGWGLSNFILAFGLVPDRLDYWPFWILEIVIALPLAILLLWRQLKHNSLSSALYGYFGLLFGYSFVSRFLNENYLGYALAILALAVLIGRRGEPDTISRPEEVA